MSAAVRKPPPPGATRQPSSPGGVNRSPSRAGASSASTSANGVQRTRSVRGSAGGHLSARGAARRPNSNLRADSGTSSQDDADADTAREETAALIQELKERLTKAETVSEEFQKQVEVLQSRLDDAVEEQAKLEEKVHEEEERVEELENDKREDLRKRRELEGIYEAERSAAMKEKEEAMGREEEMHGIIQRLKDSLAQKGDSRSGAEDDGRLSRAPSIRTPSRNSSSANLGDGHFAPPSTLQRSNSQNNSKLILQKDKVIESLRLELAEAQIKLVEMENLGGGRIQEMERVLLDTRMANARLMEENESYQLLLSEKTINGDFSRGGFLGAPSRMSEERPASRQGPSTSLADELESAEGEEGEHRRRLEAEVSSLKDQNKALTLYINKIIERLLQHQGFESILNNSDDGEVPKPGLARANTNKDLPPSPPKEEATSFLKRASSVLARSKRTSTQMAPPPPPEESSTRITADPETAPSIPLQRSTSTRVPSHSKRHSRSNSGWTNAANIVYNMNGGAPPPGGSPGVVSPGVVSPRNSFFGPNSAAAARIQSTGASPNQTTPISEVPGGNSPMMGADAQSNPDSGVGSDAPSPPRSVASSERDRDIRGGGAVMSGKGMRPLRLVQEEEEAKKMRQVDKRGSWLGWFGKNEAVGL